ncbi:DUF6913 domain-containing protein [Brumimicrobium oceani]|uniref:Uncharacterized protein n=1 Tax=Brumimicrobium oceani TaxID=2100725 RepID=A0A2U2XHA9_9FLAO|nr:hypothetical protein [Brumimicrobium oceani]PWH87175.1 hypothetical protein DIT68_02625 [Brumimicrobium oceani]
MKKRIIIISEWKSEKEFQQLKNNVERNISSAESFYYLLTVNQPKSIAELPQIEQVYYLSKKDFNLFGKIKTPKLTEVLSTSKGVLIVAMEKDNSLLKSVLKHSKLISVGMEQETLSKFDLSFSDSSLSEGKLFKQINNYLIKIQL